MKKIRIITYHNVINNGAFLQVYGLYAYLKKKLIKCDVKILNYKAPALLVYDFLKIFKLEKKKKFFNLRRYFIFRKFFQENTFILDKSLPLSFGYDDLVRKINKKKYNLLLVGSDSIWKLSDNLFLPRFPNIYWLSEKLKTHKVSYAASAYQYDPLILEKRREELKGTLQSYDLISVRDISTKRLVENLGIKNVYKIPDPAFLYEIKRTKVLEKLKKLGVKKNKPIFALLSTQNNAKIKGIVDFFRQKNYQIIGLSMYSDLVDFNLGDELDPFEWAEIFSFVTFCVTDRFHGAIFCIKNFTPFIAIETKGVTKERSKKYQLIKDFSLYDCYLDLNEENYENKDFQVKYQKVMKNWENISKVKIRMSLKEFKKISDNYCNLIKSIIYEKNDKK